MLTIFMYIMRFLKSLLHFIIILIIITENNKQIVEFII